MAWTPFLGLWKPVLLFVVAAVFLRRPPAGLPGALALAGQLVLGAAVELTCKIAALRGQYNLHIYDFYGPLEFLLLAAFGLAQFPGRAGRRAGMGAAFGMVAGMSWWEWPVMLSDGHSANHAFVVYLLLLCGLFLTLLFRLSLTSLRPLHRLPLFWIALGITVFCAVELPFRGLYNQLNAHDQELARRLYGINHFTYALRYGLVLVACWVGARYPPPLGPWTTSASPSS